MVLGAGRGQVDLINAIHEYGYEPVVASITGNYPGLKMGFKTVDVDISNGEAVLKKAQEEQIDGIVTACMDLGVPALGYVCDHMGLNGLNARSAEICENKYLMKEAFMKAGVNTARFCRVSSREELITATNDLQYPLIIKAVDLQGSRGINIVQDSKDLIEAYENTMQETNEKFCIVEEFIEGKEFGAEAFVSNGEVLFVLPCGDETFRARTNIPVGHYTPLEMEGEMSQLVTEQSIKAIKAVGLDNCAVNIDLIYKDGKVYIIELTGRIGANCLPQLTSIYYGIDINKMIIDAALGNDVKTYFQENMKEPTACYARMLFSNTSGIVKTIDKSNINNENVEEITFFVSPGDEIAKFSNSKDCIGQVVVKGQTIPECKELLERVEKNLIVDLES